MEDQNEIERIRGLVISAMQLSTDSVTAAGAAAVESLALATLEQAHQLVRCIAALRPMMRWLTRWKKSSTSRPPSSSAR